MLLLRAPQVDSQRRRADQHRRHVGHYLTAIDDENRRHGNQQGGDGSTLRDTGQLAVGQKRYTANVLAHFDVTNGLRFFIEATFVHQKVLQEGQPSFFQGTSTLGGGSRLHCDNAFLTAQNITVLRSFGLCNNITTGTFTMSRFNVDFGGRAANDFGR